MNEWFKKFFATIKEKWGKWTLVQKGIAIGIVVAVIAAIVILSVVSSKPTTVYLFNSPVNDENERESILYRLDQDNVKAYVNGEGYISVENESIARRYRSKLIAEGLAPSGADAYSLFDVTRWSRNDFDDKVNWKRSMETALEQHLTDLDGIQRASVMLTLPEESLFASTQKPVEASVILYPRGGSNVLEDKKQVQGIQRLIVRSVEGLTEDHVAIVNGITNKQINDFEGMEDTDRLSNIEKSQKIILGLETEYSAQILGALKGTYGSDRVRIANMKIEMDMSKKTSKKKIYTGVTLKPDNPDTPYDDSDIRENLVLSKEEINKTFTGTGYNPEGPAGA